MPSPDFFSVAFEEAIRWAVPATLVAAASWWALKRKDFKAQRAKNVAYREAMSQMPGKIQGLAVSIEEIRSSVTSIDAIVRAQSDLAVDGSFECDPEGANTWVNMTYARMLGVGRLDLMGNSWKNYVHPEDRDSFIPAVAASLHDHRPFSGRCRMQRSDGEEISIDVTIIPYPERPPAKRWFGKIRLVV